MDKPDNTFCTAQADCPLTDRITHLEARLQTARDALEQIKKRRRDDYESGCEYWLRGNYDDAYEYGVDTGDALCALIAAAALRELGE